MTDFFRSKIGAIRSLSAIVFCALTVNCAQAVTPSNYPGLSPDPAVRERFERFENEIREHEAFVAKLKILDRMFIQLMRNPRLGGVTGDQFQELFTDAISQFGRPDMQLTEPKSMSGCENWVAEDCLFYLSWGSLRMGILFYPSTLDGRPRRSRSIRACAGLLPHETTHAPCYFFESPGPRINLSISDMINETIGKSEIRSWKPHLLSTMLGDGNMYAKAWGGYEPLRGSPYSRYAREYIFFVSSGTLVKVDFSTAAIDWPSINFFYRTELKKD
jgi:hypothetical protein